MLGKILEIKELEKDNEDDPYVENVGYKVITDTATYKVLISGEQHCCEYFGYFDTNDNSKDFIGAELLSVELVDKALSVKTLDVRGLTLQFEDAGDDTIFVNFNTDKGLFQLAVYNFHNGYYGHDVMVSKETTIYKGEL